MTVETSKEWQIWKLHNKSYDQDEVEESKIHDSPVTWQFPHFCVCYFIVLMIL